MRMDWTRIFSAAAAGDAPEVSLPPWTGLAHFGSFDDEYQACAHRVGLVDRSHRGLLEVTGADRAKWLHNLTTNHVARLQPGEGNYAFAVNAKGRILFDMNVLVQADAIWLDIDTRWLEHAEAHLEKYHITEDVELRDRTDEFLRLSLSGPKTPDILARFGESNAPVVPYLQVTPLTIDGAEVACFRHDLCGIETADLLVPAGDAEHTFDVLRACPEVTLAGYDAVNTHRIEAAVPAPGTEINDSVLPAETCQTHRAVSYDKGCYLGQEIVERMRTRGSLARQLVLIRCDEGPVPPPGAKLHAQANDIGHVTSACFSPKHQAPLALGYARADASAEGAPVEIEWESSRTAGSFISRPQAP